MNERMRNKNLNEENYILPASNQFHLKISFQINKLFNWLKVFFFP